MPFSIFKKRKKETSNSRYHHLTIREVRDVGKDTVNLIFEDPGPTFRYDPGQFITIITEVGGKKLRRAYSLCSTPALNEPPAVTVKRVPDGAMSNHINDEFQAGQQIEVMEPMGMFTTTYDPTRKRHLVFFGGGSGITPLFSIFRTVLKEEPNSQVTLVYGNRDQASIIFREDLESLSHENDNFRLIHILETDQENYASYSGQPDQQMIMKIRDEIDPDKTAEYFVCGPEPMMDIVISSLKQAGLPEAQIKFESFEAGKTSPSDIIENGTGSSEDAAISEVKIDLDGEQYSLTLQKSRPILEQALEKDLDMPYSCQSGLCTACRGRCLEGEVSVDEAEGLSEEELEEGYVLTCVGKPLSDKIKIEIG